MAVTNNCSAMTVVFIPQVAEAIQSTERSSIRCEVDSRGRRVACGPCLQTAHPRQLMFYVSWGMQSAVPEGCKVPDADEQADVAIDQCHFVRNSWSVPNRFTPQLEGTHGAWVIASREAGGKPIDA
jgi:hypothetical protein